MRPVPKTTFVMIKSKLFSGITFLELLIILTIVAVLFTAAVPLLSRSAYSFTFNSFAKDIYYLCRYLQSASVTEYKVYCLRIDKDTGKAWAVYLGGDVKENRAQGRFGRMISVPEGSQITALNPDNEEISNICFFPDSSAESSTITIKGKNNLQATIKIEGASGGVKIE